MFSFRNLSLLLVCFALVKVVAQPGRVYYEDTPQDRGRFSIAAADQVPLFFTPVRISGHCSNILHGRLEHKGEEAFVKSTAQLITGTAMGILDGLTTDI